MNPQSMTWASANAAAEEARRQNARARLAATAHVKRANGEAAFALLAVMKTLLVMIALAGAIALINQPSPVSQIGADSTLLVAGPPALR
jgi:hypothetical protein